MTTLKTIKKDGYELCGDCGDLIDSYSEWEGEDENGKGSYRVTYHCTCCWAYRTETQPE